MKSMTQKLLPIFLLLIFMSGAKAQFTEANSRSLFSDVKAFRTGDAVMVIITEVTKADNSASTSESRETELGGGFGLSTGSSNTDIDAELGTGNSFSGSGQTTRQEQISAKISARVVEVDENGNLKIEGQRKTTINGEEQTIIISGLVRPVDIMPSNSVYSYNVMDLALTIEGIGTVSDTQEPGLLTKFIRFLF